MKKIISALIITAMLLSTAFLLSSCSDGDDTTQKETVTRITLDVNPSIELIVDNKNKVTAVTALNDDGAIVIAGEAFIGKTPEEATKLILDISLDTGYIVSGNVEAGTNEIKISVSGDSEYADKLTKSIKAEVELFIDTEKITAEYKEAAALTKAELEKMVESVSELAEEELSKLTENELYKLLEESRIETATLLTEEMREAYNTAKEYEIEYTKRQEYAKIMEELGGFSAMLHSSYKKAVDDYHAAIEEVENFRYENLISPTSEYQKALLKMREAKVEFLKERQYVASLSINDSEYLAAKISLQASEQDYDAAYNLLVSIGNTVNASFDKLLATLRASEAALEALEEQLFKGDLLAQIDSHAKEIEDELNAAKDQFFADFEKSHGEDINASLAELMARKNALIAANSQNNN